MSQADSFDASIPVLTEIVSSPAHPAPAATPDTATPGAAEWAALEQRLNERILQQLTSRVDFMLEQRVRDGMAAVLTHVLHDVTTELREGLHDTIGRIVTHAVQQEIADLQARK